MGEKSFMFWVMAMAFILIACGSLSALLSGILDKKDVPKAEIVANNYDLSINKYKEVVYEKVEYPAPAVLISEIEELQKEISSDLSELKKMLGE